MLVGEARPDLLNYHGSDFVTRDANRANLWLTGIGPIEWRHNRLDVKNDAIRINDTLISTSHAHSEVHIMLYPDGRISKGQLVQHQ